MPSRWMIHQLVANALATKSFTVPTTDGKTDWHTLLIRTLKVIQQRCDVGLDNACDFSQINQDTPLFPNHELFDEWDALRFSQALLHHLEKDLFVEH